MRLPAHLLSGVFLFFILFVFCLVSPSNVHASISACSASVDTHTIGAGNDGNFTFNVTNDDSANTVVWVKITRPSAYFTITSGESVEFDIIETAMPPGIVGGFGLLATADSSSQASANWTVEVSDDAEGAGAVTCTGDLGTAIDDGTNPVAIVSLTVSSVTDTSVNISWTTSAAANSTINYGLTSDYGSSEVDETLTTSHSISLSGLTANTSYHYSVSSTDGTYSDTTSDNTFTTAVTGTTSTTTTVVVTTTSSSSTTSSSTTAKAVVDSLAPSVRLTTEFAKSYEEAPKILGRATDNKGVASVEYSLDGGKNWLPVDSISKPNAATVTFDFTPESLDDDNYKVRVRAKDTSGNIGASKEYLMVIDRLPPQVGASISSIGPQILRNTNGIIFGLEGLDQKITLSSIGGATSIDLVSGKSTFSLLKNPDNGLWSGILSFTKSGVYDLTAESIDGADNKTSRKLSTVIILPNGQVTNGKSPIKDAVISIFYKDPVTKQFVLWEASSYGQKNPQMTDENGKYILFMPSGTYYLEINAPQYKRLRTNIFTLNTSLPIDSDFKLTRKKEIVVGSFHIPLPDFSQESVDIALSSEKIFSKASIKDKLIGRAIPDVDIQDGTTRVATASFAGKPTVVSILNSWDPQAFSQISILEGINKDDTNVITIFEQETSSKTSIFKKRGGYSISMLSDVDGKLIEPLFIQSLPMHVFLDRKGFVKNVKYGVLNKDELSKN